MSAPFTYRPMTGRSLLREGPHHDGIVGFVVQGMPPAPVPRPQADEVGAGAGSIAPGAGLYPVQIEAAFGQQVSETRLGPARTVVRNVVDADQEGHGRQKVAAGPEHFVYMLS